MYIHIFYLGINQKYEYTSIYEYIIILIVHLFLGNVPFVCVPWLIPMFHMQVRDVDHFLRVVWKASHVWQFSFTCMYTSNAGSWSWSASSCRVKVIICVTWTIHWSDKAPTNKTYRRASSEQRPRTRSCHESERLV